MPDIETADQPLGLQTKTLRYIIMLIIAVNSPLIANGIVIYHRTGQPIILIATIISFTFLCASFVSLWLLERGKFKMAVRIFIAAAFIRAMQFMLITPTATFPISIMYLTIFIVLSVFLSGPKRGFAWVGLGICASITAIVIRHYTDLPVAEFKDPLTHFLVVEFMPVICLTIITTLCVFIFRQFHKSLSDSAAARLRLEHSNKTLENFVHVASHDIQEPLRTITGYAQLLEDTYKGKFDREADEYIHFISERTLRMQRFIKDLLNYSRLKTEEILPQQTSLNEVMGQVLKNLNSVIKESGAILKTDNLPTVMAKPSQMAQLFQNLISNAIKFRSEQTPQIEITIQNQGENWLFAIEDNGIGIDPENLDKIFIVFHRLHTQDKYPGSGLGLAIVQEIVIAHGGKIWAESVPGKGSTFFFTLPITS
jgi:signal transduction histidine kinase